MSANCRDLVAQALAILDAQGVGATPAACHLQEALDSLDLPDGPTDLKQLTDTLWPARPDHDMLGQG